MEIAPHRPLLARNPLMILAVSLSAGILVIQLHPVSLKLLLAFCAAFSVLTVNAVVMERNRMAVVCLTTATLFCGGCLAILEHRSLPQTQLRNLLDHGSIVPDEPVELTGVIHGPVDVARDGLFFSLKVTQVRSRGSETRVSGVVAFTAALGSESAKAAYERLELRHGARLRVMTALRRANSFRNPGVALRTEYLDRKGYDAAGFIKSALLVERLEDEDVLMPVAWLYAWRTQLQREIDSKFSAQTAGVLDAALLGNRYNLSPATSERFRSGGTFHVLVISGLHISFIGAVILMITRRFTKRRSVQFIASVLVLWGYTVAVGAESSVVRAASMFTIVALAPVIFRRASSLNALGGTALLLLVSHPGNLFDPSFQLTFLSVLAIVTVAWPLMQKIAAVGMWQPSRETPYPPSCTRWFRSMCEVLFWSERNWQQQMAQSAYRCKLFKAPLAAWLEKYRLQRAARYSVTALLVSLSVQIVLLPFLLVYFHRLSLASLILNIGVSLIMAAEVIVALLALLLAQLSTGAAAPLIALTNILNWLMVHSVDPFTRTGLASIRLPGYSGKLVAIYAIYYMPLILISLGIWRWNPFDPSRLKPRRRLALEILVGLQILLLLLVVFYPFSSVRPDGRLHISFLDVGQGDSALVTMPDGVTLLIDGGGRPKFFTQGATGSVEDDEAGQDRRSIGEAVVSEYLWSRGLDSIDYILATHADADHIGGLNDVARNFKVRGALIARCPIDDPEFTKFAATLRLQQVPQVLLGAGDVLRFGRVTATVLWPPAEASCLAPSRNNESVVLRLQFGERSILLTGDIESGAETAILDANQDMRADVVKVAHHGSRTSSIERFVAATQPQFAIVSVGQTSIFGHPHSEVVNRWKAAGAELMTTGMSGTITVTTDGEHLTVDTFVPK